MNFHKSNEYERLCLFFLKEIFNVSGNNLDSLMELSCLDKLQELNANNNRLENLRELVQLLSVWPRLKRLDTSRNPMCSKARYRERLIVVSNHLGKNKLSITVKDMNILSCRYARW
jgi:Leucine-rich repeat (LRR) protein